MKRLLVAEKGSIDPKWLLRALDPVSSFDYSRVGSTAKTRKRDPAKDPSISTAGRRGSYFIFTLLLYFYVNLYIGHVLIYLEVT